MKKKFFFIVLIFAFVVSCQSALSVTAKKQFDKGTNLDRLKNYKEAIEAYTLAIKLDPKYVDAYIKRGEAIFALDPTDAFKSRDDFTTAIELDPDNTDAYYDRARINLYMVYNNQGMKDMKMAARLGHKEAREYLRILKKRTKAKQVY